MGVGVHGENLPPSCRGKRSGRSVSAWVPSPALWATVGGGRGFHAAGRSEVGAAVRAEIPACRAGVEFVADALEGRDAAVALWVVVERQRISLVDRVEYHVDGPGGIHHQGEVGVVHGSKGKWEIEPISLFDRWWRTGSGHGRRGKRVKSFGSKQASVSKPQPAVNRASGWRSRSFASGHPHALSKTPRREAPAPPPRERY